VRHHADEQNRSRDTFTCPSLAYHHAKNRFAPCNKREAKRRKAHANHVRAAPANVAIRCAFSAAARQLGARPPSGATPRHSPPAITPMAQPQNRVSSRHGAPGTNLAECFARSALFLRLSTLRADRSFCRPTDPEPPGTRAQSSASILSVICQYLIRERICLIRRGNTIGSMTSARIRAKTNPILAVRSRLADCSTVPYRWGPGVTAEFVNNVGQTLEAQHEALRQAGATII
jgi:hypothetical protein